MVERKIRMNDPQQNQVYLTQSKYKSYKKQLAHMEDDVSKKLAKMLAASPGSGMGRPLDLPIHDIARRFYSEIDKLRFKISIAQIIDNIVQLDEPFTVGLGASVSVIDLFSQEEDIYVILGADEADPSSGKISFLSPLGRELVGKSEGAIITLPNGAKYKIGKIEYNALDFDYPSTDWNYILESLTV